MTRTSVLLISDEAIPRFALKHLLAAEPGFKLAGEVVTKSALQQASKLKPQVIVIHATPRVSCAELIASLHKAVPEAGIVILGREADQSYLGLLLASGALGYVQLQSSPSELFKAIHAAGRGERFIDPALSNEMFDLLARRAATGTKWLSQREEQILRMFAYGHNPKEISGRLNISRKSIETYRVRIREKLGLRTRAEMVRYAIAAGMLKANTTDKW